MRLHVGWARLLLCGPFDIILVLRGSNSHPLQPVYIVLVHDHEPKNDREPPERVREHGARMRIAAKLVKAPRGPEPDGVRHEARQRERPSRKPRERDECRADARQKNYVPQRDEPVLGRVEHGEHAVAALRVRRAYKVRERVEVRKLPREHQREQRPRRERVVQCCTGDNVWRCCEHRGEVKRDGMRCGGAREERATDGCPAHEGRDSADDGANPGVPDGAAFHPGVGSCVERDVGCAEEGGRRIAHRPEECGAREARNGRKGGCVCRA